MDIDEMVFSVEEIKEREWLMPFKLEKDMELTISRTIES